MESKFSPFRKRGITRVARNKRAIETRKPRARTRARKAKEAKGNA